MLVTCPQWVRIFQEGEKVDLRLTMHWKRMDRNQRRLWLMETNLKNWMIGFFKHTSETNSAGEEVLYLECRLPIRNFGFVILTYERSQFMRITDNQFISYGKSIGDLQLLEKHMRAGLPWEHTFLFKPELIQTG
jgi:hypothetical protein